MKKKKTTLIAAAAVLVILLGVLAVVKRDSASRESAENRKETLLDLTAADISAVSYSAKDSEEVSFARRDGTWYCVTDETVNPDQTQVGILAASLTGSGLTQVLEKVEDPGLYGLADPSYEVDLTDTDGKTYHISVGNVNEMTGDVYVNLDGDEKTVYAVSPGLIANLDKTLPDYLPEETASSGESPADN